MLEPGLYRHSKSGRLYTLHFIETDSETLEERISYQAEYGEKKRWTRPARMWNEMVEVNGQLVERFVPVEELEYEDEEKKEDSFEQAGHRIKAVLCGITFYHPTEVRLRHATSNKVWTGEVVSPYFERMKSYEREARIGDQLQRLSLDDFEMTGLIIGLTPAEDKNEHDTK